MTERYVMRPYAGDEDYWHLRGFLRTVYRLNGGQERSWQAYRWDYCQWHVYPTVTERGTGDSVLIWEIPGSADDGDQIVAAALSEGWGDVWLQVRPDARGRVLEEAMVIAAEEYLAAPRGDGHALTLWAHADDPLRRGILQARGYIRGDWPEYQRWRHLEGPLPDMRVPVGYAVRALGGPEEHAARSTVSWLAFHPDDPRYDGDASWYAERIQRAPLYRRDLDLVAVAPDGTLAGFATVWFDDVSRTAAFEPVGVARDHQRRGVGRALMAEGLRRARDLGATRAFVGSFGEGAHALYSAVGFTRYLLAERWQRNW